MIDAALMAHFVGAFHMDIGKIPAVFQQCPDGGIGLALVIGFQRSGGTGDIQHFHARAHGDALEQVHRGDHHAVQAGLLPEAAQAGLGTGTPEPEGIGLILAFRGPPDIQGVVVEDLKALFHHIPEQGMLRQIGTDLFPQMVMGLGKFQHLALIPDGDMAVAGTGMELDLVGIESLPDGIHQNVRVLRGDLAGRVVQDGLFFIGLILCDGDDVAPQHHIGVRHLHTHAEGFQRRPAGIILFGIVTQHREVCHIAAGLHRGRHRSGKAHFALAGQFIHHRGSGTFQRGSAFQRSQRFVCHTVTENHNILHGLTLPVRHRRTIVFVHDSTFHLELQYEKRTISVPFFLFRWSL